MPEGCGDVYFAIDRGPWVAYRGMSGLYWYVWDGQCPCKDEHLPELCESEADARQKAEERNAAIA